MVTTNKKEYYEKLISLRSHGIVKDRKFFYNKKILAHGIMKLNHFQITIG